MVSQLHNEYNPDDHIYYIGIEVEHFDNVPDGLECITIPNGRYAVIHKNKDLSAGDVYGVWDEAWMKEDEGYTYEYFYESIITYRDRIYGKIEQDFEMDLCIPIN
ncbi:GyrI-like domain-containing protein [Paenibacillus tarimensis]